MVVAWLWFRLVYLSVRTWLGRGRGVGRIGGGRLWHGVLSC